MMRAALTVLFAFTTAAAWANVPPDPPPPPKPQAVVAPVIVGDVKGEQYRLIIPRNVLRQAMRQLGEAQPPGSRTRSLVAALALSAGLASVVLVRKKSATVKALTVAAVVVAGGWAATSWSWANLAPPPDFEEGLPGKPVPKIVIEVSRQGTAVELFIPLGLGGAGEGFGEPDEPEDATDPASPFGVPGAAKGGLPPGTGSGTGPDTPPGLGGPGPDTIPGAGSAPEPGPSGSKPR